MKAVLMKEFGSADVLYIGEAEKKPSPAGDQVLIKVATTSINRPDLVQREGNYPRRKGIQRFSGLRLQES